MKEISREILKYLQLNENKNAVSQMQDTMKPILDGNLKQRMFVLMFF